MITHPFPSLKFVDGALNFRGNTPLARMASWVEACILGNELGCRKKIFLNGGAFEGATLDCTTGCKVHRIPSKLPNASLIGCTVRLSVKWALYTNWR